MDYVLGIDVKGFLKKCYKDLKSCQEIKEEIYKRWGIIVSRQRIWRALKNYKETLRPQKESMKVRAITGRMDYNETKKHIDYKHRKIDYKKAVRMKLLRKKGKATPKVKIISLKHWQIERLKKFAKNNFITMSDAVKIKYFPKSAIKKFIVRSRVS